MTPRQMLNELIRPTVVFTNHVDAPWLAEICHKYLFSDYFTKEETDRLKVLYEEHFGYGFEA